MDIYTPVVNKGNKSISYDLVEKGKNKNDKRIINKPLVNFDEIKIQPRKGNIFE